MKELKGKEGLKYASGANGMGLLMVKFWPKSGAIVCAIRARVINISVKIYPCKGQATISQGFQMWLAYLDPHQSPHSEKFQADRKQSFLDC